jgi:hypothetical protein
VFKRFGRINSSFSSGHGEDGRGLSSRVHPDGRPSLHCAVLLWGAKGGPSTEPVPSVESRGSALPRSAPWPAAWAGRMPVRGASCACGNMRQGLGEVEEGEGGGVLFPSSLLEESCGLP